MTRKLLFSAKNIKWIQYVVLIVSLLGCAKEDKDPEKPEKLVTEERLVNEVLRLTVREEFSGVTEMERLGSNLALTDFVPTGVSLGAGKELDMDVVLTKGNALPQVLIGTYSRYLAHWNPQEQALAGGGNRVVNTTKKEQLIYIRYVGDNPSSEAQITIKGGYKVPYFKLNETQNSDFVAMLNNCNCPDAQLYGNKTIVVASVTNFKKYINQDWNQLILTLEEIIETEAYIDGLDSSLPVHVPNRNRYLFTESDDPDFWMAATWYRTFYNEKDAIDFILDINKLKSDGWGPWHELGHQHQLKNLTWDEVVEVTVNIYSLRVERSFGLTSRLKRDNIWSDVDEYLNRPIAQRNYNDESVDLFLRLGLYQQLWLQYGDSFFIELHKKVREENKNIVTDEEKMAYFMLKASEVTQNNLKQFFKEWGFVIGSQHFEALDALGLPEPSVDITALRE